MAETIKVFPGTDGANLSHPSAGPIKASGSMWPQDQFTFRRLADGSVTRDHPAAAADHEKDDVTGAVSGAAAAPVAHSGTRRHTSGPDKV